LSAKVSIHVARSVKGTSKSSDGEVEASWVSE
jgi:hypothetical protein